MDRLDYDRLAAEYAAHRRVHPGVLRELCEVIQSRHTVLEVGCGTANYVIALTESTGCRGWGVDPSAEMLACAQHQLDSGHPMSTVRLSRGRAECMDVPDGQFALVFSVDVIHHVQNYRAYLQGAYRALGPDGLICTATDSEWIIRHREPLTTYWPETIDIELARYPRIRRLKALYREAGFHTIKRDTVEHRAVVSDVQVYRDKAFSSLHLISESAFQRGLLDLERDFGKGPVPLVSRYALLWGAKG
jgi:ubiquinone/menaquinone biosynthesis C-methylase UbiE